MLTKFKIREYKYFNVDYTKPAVFDILISLLFRTANPNSRYFVAMHAEIMTISYDDDGERDERFLEKRCTSRYEIV